MPKAVFLDRDGTINREVDVLRNIRQLRILPGSARALAAFRRLGYLIIVVSNQPVVARGWLSEKEVEEINQVLLRRLAKKGAKVDAFYFCPHHPKANLKRYRIKCSCRKPKPGLIRKALKKFKIDPRRSFMVGDHAWDIQAGQAAKLKTILVQTSARSRDDLTRAVQPDFKARNLVHAARLIQHLTSNI